MAKARCLTLLFVKQCKAAAKIFTEIILLPGLFWFDNDEVFICNCVDVFFDADLVQPQKCT